MQFDWLQILIGLFGGGTVVGTIVGLITIPAAKKKANAEAKKEEAEAKNAEIENIKSALNEWQKIAEERQEACQEKDARIADLMGQIDARYVDIGEWRDKYDGLRMENTDLKVKMAGMVPRICEVKGCATREPQSGW
jgi:gas vesicle protein